MKKPAVNNILEKCDSNNAQIIGKTIVIYVALHTLHTNPLPEPTRKCYLLLSFVVITAIYDFALHSLLCRVSEARRRPAFAANHIS